MTFISKLTSVNFFKTKLSIKTRYIKLALKYTMVTFSTVFSFLKSSFLTHLFSDVSLWVIFYQGGIEVEYIF